MWVPKLEAGTRPRPEGGWLQLRKRSPAAPLRCPASTVDPPRGGQGLRFVEPRIRPRVRPIRPRVRPPVPPRRQTLRCESPVVRRRSSEKRREEVELDG
jgi:hypothetical protein